MAAAVLQPLQSLSINNEIMAPSPISPNASRHGRGRHGGSVAKGGKTRGRGYSIVDDRDGMILKALNWVLKRTIEEGEEQDEGEEKLVADSEGFVDCEELVRFPQPNNPHFTNTCPQLAAPHLSSLSITFPELQSFIASPASKARFSLKLKPDSADEEDLDETDYLVRLTPSAAPASPTSASAPKLTPLSLTTEDLPDLIVYETSYPNYPLILASGSIKRCSPFHLSPLPLTGPKSKPRPTQMSAFTSRSAHSWKLTLRSLGPGLIAGASLPRGMLRARSVRSIGRRLLRGGLILGCCTRMGR